MTTDDLENITKKQSFFDGEKWRGFETQLKLVRRNSKYYLPYKVAGPGDIGRCFSKLQDCDVERCYAAYIDPQGQICGVRMVSQGGISSAPVSPADVYKGAILANATNVILVHNHPGGDPSPSSDDQSITAAMLHAGRILGIRFKDHVIIGYKKYFSFLESDML